MGVNNHIKQRDKWDCVIASVAMMTESDYENVLEIYEKLYPNHKKNGLTDDEIFHLLQQFGVRPILVDAVFSGLDGIMFLPSRNDKNGSHAVYFDGQRVLDPNYQFKNKKYYSTRIRKNFPLGTQMIIDKNNPLCARAIRKLKG